MLDFLDGIYQYQANTSTSRNTTQSTTRSTTRSTTVSTSSTVDTSANTTVSTSNSTSKSTTTTFNTTFSTSYTTTFSTSFSTSYSTALPSTRQPSSGWYGPNSTYQWTTWVGTGTVTWGGSALSGPAIYGGITSTQTSWTSGGWTYLRGPLNCDVNLKTNISPAPNYLAAINEIPVHTFNYKDNTEVEPQLGVMAQEVEAVAPELMGEGESNKVIYPQQIFFAMLKSIQELSDKVSKLEEKIK